MWPKFYIMAILPLFMISNFTDARSRTSLFDISQRKNYEHFKKNDERAMPFVKRYIFEAKQKQDYRQLAQAYKDAIYYSSNESLKLVYADSTIVAAIKTRDADLISNAYLGKGIVYYFNFKKFEPALTEYLKAFEYTRNSRNQYQIHKVKYHLGVVKSYLGFYEEALELFKDCIRYFDEQSKIGKHANLKYNDEKGYMNSIHQSVICLRNLGKRALADSLVQAGLHSISGRGAYNLEESYLLKCKGISEFSSGNYRGAEMTLRRALPGIRNAQDFAWEAVVRYYLAKSRLAQDSEISYAELTKVDSIFNRTHFILPELRICYEDLINMSRKDNDLRRELYFTRQLLKVDSIIGKDFSHLSSKIHRQYDRQSLLYAKEQLEHKSRIRSLWTQIFIFSAVLLIIALLFRLRRDKNVRRKYRELQVRIKDLELHKERIEDKESGSERKSILTKDVFDGLAEKIQSFEEQRIYLQKGLKLNTLAKKLGTNTYYLSTYINETKSINFSQYINQLRINYITQLLYKDRKFLNYTMEALAEECGMSSRQSFSDIFYDINGIRPKDFIKTRMDELSKGKG